MPNHLITIGKEQRPVNFGRNFWSEVELLTKKNITEILDIKELTSIRNQNAIAYAALKWGEYDPKLGKEPQPFFSIYQVSEWIDSDPDVMTQFYEKLTSSMPIKKKADVSE